MLLRTMADLVAWSSNRPFAVKPAEADEPIHISITRHVENISELSELSELEDYVQCFGRLLQCG